MALVSLGTMLGSARPRLLACACVCGLAGWLVAVVVGLTHPRNTTTTTPPSLSLSRNFSPRGVISCFMSHQRFWASVIERGDEVAIVLEDDACLEPGFAENCKARIAELTAHDPVRSTTPDSSLESLSTHDSSLLLFPKSF